MSTEEPGVPETAPTPPQTASEAAPGPASTLEPAPAPPAPSENAPQPPTATTSSPQSPPPPGSATQRLLLIVGGVAALVLLVAFALSQLSANNTQPAALTYTVQPYNPPAQLISASDHVVAYEKPDQHSQSLIMFGRGIALNVTGRVSMGLGNDWYAIAWNGGTAFIHQQDAVPGVPVAPPITAARVPPMPPPDTLDTSTDTDNSEAAPPPPQSGPPDLTGVRWLHRPTQRDFEGAYPRRALNDGANGHVTLQCTAADGGWLDCSVSNESPRGYGFGRAAIQLSHQFRLEPTTPDGRSVAGGRVEVPVEFRSN